jgi:hypothetical protein
MNSRWLDPDRAPKATASPILSSWTGGIVADVKSCGPGAPMLALSSRVLIPWITPWATVAKKPGTPRRSRISVKTIAQGMPDVG